MADFKESFFKVFQTDARQVLRKFFENRAAKITVDIATGFSDPTTLARMVALGFLDADEAAGVYRLDDRTETYLEQMLGAEELAHASWLTDLLEEMQRRIDAFNKQSDPHKAESHLSQIRKFLLNIDARARRHLEVTKAAVDFDYRAGGDHEEKFVKLKWHLERARSYGRAIGELDNRLRNDSFFQTQNDLDVLSLRGVLITRCQIVGDALIDVYQCIEEYLNRIHRDYMRTRKLIRLRGLMERHEHLPTTNLEEVSSTAEGPWFRETRFRTALDLSVLDSKPELLVRALQRAGMLDIQERTRQVRLHTPPDEDMPAIIDWQEVYQSFCYQKHDLFVFLQGVRIDGRPLMEEELIDGFCSILCNEHVAHEWSIVGFPINAANDWEYAVVTPPATLTS